MAEKLQFELVSPERLLLDEPVEMVVVPGTEGDFGVLKGHAPMISTVRPGVIEMHDDGQVRQRIFVDGGFAEVTPDRCTVLADKAVKLEEIDRAAVEGELKALRERLAAADSDSDRAAVAAMIEVAEAKLAVVG